MAHFIPVSTNDLMAMCLSDDALPQHEAEDFTALGKSIRHKIHFDLYDELLSLKDAYAQINPDADTIKPQGLNDGSSNKQGSNSSIPSKNAFDEQLYQLLKRANYGQIDQASLLDSLKNSSLIKIRLHVDFSLYDEVLVFYRGKRQQTTLIPQWFGLRKKEVTFTNYERVVVFIRFKGERDNTTLLRLFQNVPEADLDMLFPDTKIGMRWLDKLIIGVPAVISGIVVATTKLGATLILLGSLLGFWLGLHAEPVVIDKAAIIAIFAGFAALGSYIWKQFSNFKNRKLQFIQKLTSNLYFKLLDNNAGVFYRLIDNAEEEEYKETLLSYYFLLQQKAPLTAEQLDRAIEVWFRDKWKLKVDFDIHDALHKLQRFKLATKKNETWQAVPLRDATQTLQTSVR